MNPEKSGTPLTFSVAQGKTEQFLATRQQGHETRSTLENAVLQAAPVETLAIDFTGVEIMSISFADELIGKFYVSLAAGDIDAAAVYLVGLNSVTRDELNVCLERRKLAALDGDLGALIGQASAIEETYSCALQLGEFRASDIADAMGISITNANNRLKRLADAGTLHRERVSSPDHGGKEFIYRVPQLVANTT